MTATAALESLPVQARPLGQRIKWGTVDALTMTLLPRLALRTGARVLFAVAERHYRSGKWAGPRFDVHLIAAPAALYDPDLHASVAAMNAGVQAIAERDLAQYQWTYKRFNHRPPDSGLSNPYVPEQR